MNLDDIPFVGKKWHSGGSIAKSMMLTGALFGLLLLIFKIIIQSDQVYSVITKWNLTEKLSYGIGDKMIHLPLWVVELVLANIILLYAVAMIILYVLYHNDTKIKTVQNETRMEKAQLARAKSTLMDAKKYLDLFNLTPDQDPRMHRLPKRRQDELSNFKTELDKFDKIMKEEI